MTRTEDYYAEPQHCYYAVRGSLLHGFLEVDLPGVIKERRIYKEVTFGPYAPWILSGRLDYYDTTTGFLLDFKTMSDKGTYVLFNQGVKTEHVWQLNLYRWLLDGGHLDSPTGQQVHWPVNKMQIAHLFMNRVICSGERVTETFSQSSSPNFGKTYKLEVPGSRKMIKGARYNKWQIEFDIPDVPFKKTGQVEKYIEENTPERIRGFAEPSYVPEGVLHDPNKSWECGFCPVQKQCKDYEKAIAVVNAMKNDGFAGVIF